MYLILALDLETETGRPACAWWRPAARENAWSGPGSTADPADVANAIRSGHAVFSRIKRKDTWVLGPRVEAGVDEHGRASLYLNGSPESVDEALTWLGRNWRRREFEGSEGS